MILRKYTILSFLWLIAAPSNFGWAKSLYVINDTETLTLQAYKIEGTNLIWQTQYTCVSQVSGGAVGIALDESEYGAFLFVTFESDNKIELVNAKSMQYVATVTAPQANNLAGIVVDQGRRKVYVIDRGENNLYIYSWNAMTRELTLDLPAPYYVELQDCHQGYGLAVDEGNGRLYVGDNTTSVKYYDTSDWAKLGQFTITDTVVGVALNAQNQFVYTGSSQFGSSTRLTKYSLGTTIETSVDVGSPVLGIAVDEDTSLVYLTTYEGGLSPDRLIIYNSALVKQQWESGDIGNPAGVCVPKGNILYKEDRFSLSKIDDVVDCASPPDQFTYTISYNANGYADTGVVIIDYLPLQVDYLSCTGGGSYDAPTHTVTWTLGDISGSASGTLEISVQVNGFARPGTTITNAVEMEGDTYYSKRTEDTDICCWYPGEIIYVDEDAMGYNNGTSWDDAYAELRDALEHVEMCPGAVTAIWVAAGTYKPTESPTESYATFELIDGIDMYGHFAGVGTYETSIDERDFDNPANETRLDGQIGGSAWDAVTYVVTARNITELVFDGFTVRGAYYGAGILIEDCPSADLRIARCQLEDNSQYGIESKAEVPSASHFQLQDSVVTGNTTYGVFCNRSWLQIMGTTFDGNNETPRGISASESAVDVYDSDVKNHTGAGIYADDADLVVDNCWVEGNLGVGVCSVSFCYVDIARSVITSNGWDGIYLENSLETRITNNWVYDNIGGGSYDHYAGIYLYGAIDQAQIRNNTICNNNTHGIYSDSGTEPEVVNCIVYGNAAQIGTDSGESLGTVSYSCIEGDPVYPGDDNINTDPLFLGAGIGDYHLTKDSGCVDTGKPDSTVEGETDIDGNPRVMEPNGVVDMGADEDYPHCREDDYDEWVLMGRPDCWMTLYQCEGDAALDVHPRGYRVYATDLAILTASWKLKIGDAGLNPCADFDHKAHPRGYRVYAGDLYILQTYWKWKDPDMPGECLNCPGRGESLPGGGGESITSVAEAVSVEYLLDWLAEIWLDPEVQEAIDAEAWLKLYLSLKE